MDSRTLSVGSSSEFRVWGAGLFKGRPLERARILLADDHAEFLLLAAGLVESEFNVLKTFGNGQAVVDEFRELNPDLVVLDISMPGLNGIETAQKLRAAQRNAKIVFLTVHKDLDYLRSALATGALGYVAKDRLASDLILAMRAALAGRRFVSCSLPQEQDT
jgi:Response regulator containing a CheY-like receiver domain and an HTH DNA-binding domain